MNVTDYTCADEAAHVFAYWSDSLEFLRGLPDDWCHAIITDPPYGLADHKPERVIEALTAWASGDRERVPTGRGFMGREWDAFVPPPALWDECLRVLKPGGHLAVFAGSRTVDLMGLSIRLAGFEMRDGIAAWIYGSGFPKSLDVGKAIDKRGGTLDLDLAREIAAAIKAAREARGWTSGQADQHFCGGTTNWSWFEGRKGDCRPPTPETFARITAEWPELTPWAERVAQVDREVVGSRTTGAAMSRLPSGETLGTGGTVFGSGQNVVDITAPATDAAREWQGYGTALKPAHEPILLARRPLSGTVAANVLAHGAGALNIDACRVAHGADDDIHAKNPHTQGGFGHAGATVYGTGALAEKYDPSGGRWPTNVVLAHHPDCVEVGTREVRTGTAVQRNRSGEKPASVYGKYDTTTDDQTYGTDGRETIPAFDCHPDCQVAALDEQSGTLTSGGGDRGTTSRDGLMGPDSDRGRSTTYARDSDTGGASRFFPTFRYQAKAPKSERPEVDGRGHPTVKPLGLMRWLVRLLVPAHEGQAGMVIDPFAGSGATLEAARLEGVRAVGIERDEHSVRLIAKRLGVEFHEPVPEPETPAEEPAPEPVAPVVEIDDARARRHDLAVRLKARAEEVIEETRADLTLAKRHDLAVRLKVRAEEVIEETRAGVEKVAS